MKIQMEEQVVYVEVLGEDNYASLFLNSIAIENWKILWYHNKTKEEKKGKNEKC